MKLGDVYYEKHTVVGVSKRTNTVSEAYVEIVNMLPIEVLDQIRAEIDQKQYDFMSDGDYNEGVRFGLMLAYQIIDKYKAESEVQDADSN